MPSREKAIQNLADCRIFAEREETKVSYAHKIFELGKPETGVIKVTVIAGGRIVSAELVSRGEQ